MLDDFVKVSDMSLSRDETPRHTSHEFFYSRVQCENILLLFEIKDK